MYYIILVYIRIKKVKNIDYAYIVESKWDKKKKELLNKL